MFKFTKELVFYDEKLAPICLAADLLGFISLCAYFLLGPLFSPEVTAVILKVASHFQAVAVLLFAAFFVVWAWVSGYVWKYSIVRSKKALIVITHIVNIIYMMIAIECDLPM